MQIHGLVAVKTVTPTVSIVIAAYNCSQTIGATLASVFCQTYTNFEVIVIDDGSSDTAYLNEALAPFQKHIIHCVQPNQGVSSARNCGIKQARGKLIAILDSDDLWHPTFLEKQVSFLCSRPDVDLVYSDSIFFGDTPFAGHRYSDYHAQTRPVSLDALLGQRATIITSCVVARRDALMETGLFDVTLRRSEDFHLWCRIAACGKKIEFLDEPLGRRRIGCGLTSDGIAFMGDLQKALRKLLDIPEISRSHASIIKRKIALHQAEQDLALGKRCLREGKKEDAYNLLSSANKYKVQWKLVAILLCLKIFPPLARWIACKADGRQTRLYGARS
jgi:glycosyltransferase involved in cell wall biosynthesis